MTTYENPCASMEFLLNGTSLCVAAVAEVWAKPKEGDAFPVHTIADNREHDAYGFAEEGLPFYCLTVSDYKGKSYSFEDLTYGSQCELVDFACDELF